MCFLIPICIANYHYVLVYVDINTKVIQYFDSIMDTENGTFYCNTVKRYLTLKWNQLFENNQINEDIWRTIVDTHDCPQQSPDSNNCLVYVCLIADRLSIHADYTILTQNLVNARGRTYIEACIHKNKLL